MSEATSIEERGNDRNFANIRGIKIAGFGIFMLLLVQTLVWASEFLIPVTTSILAYFVLNRPRRWLAKLGLPPSASAIVFTALLILATTFAVLKLSQPLANFITDLPDIIRQVDEKIAAKGGALEAVNEAAEAADEILNPESDESVEVEVVTKTKISSVIAGMAPSLLSQMGFSILLLFFLISSGDMFIRKTLQSIGRFSDKRRAVRVLHDIEDKLGRYLGGITVINAGLGVCISVAMFAWGLPSFLMIGAVAFLFNFIPFVGAIAGSTIAAALAFVTLDGIWPAVGVWATYMTLTSMEAQLVTPLLISRHMKLNTTVVFLSVAFFAWIWSIMGMIVALPILTVVKIACDEIDGLSAVARFLGQDQTSEIDEEVV